MKLLAGTFYDPVGAAVTKATSALQAMTAFDTTNLRLTFTAPSNGTVLVRSLVQQSGAASDAQYLIGVLDGATVKARQAPVVTPHASASANTNLPGTCTMLVGGLTPGTSYTWDLAYSVEVVVASCVLRYGGLNNTTANDNWGGIAYEIWDTQGLLGFKHYDPGTAAATLSVVNPLALTAVDTTNLRITFPCPSSGKVMVRIRGTLSGTTDALYNTMWGVLDGATLRGRSRGIGCRNQRGSFLVSDQITNESKFLVSGLTPGTSYTWDAAVAVDTGLTNGLVKMGGPDDTTTDNAWGGFAFDIWNIDDLPHAIGSVS